MNKKTAAIAVAIGMAFTSAAPVSAAGVSGAFSKGRTHFSLTAGNGYAFDENYLVLGVGASYYLIDGLNVGLYVESWSGAEPAIYKVTPSVQYVFYQIPRLAPYIGGFYRHSYIENSQDLNSVGGRAGVYISAGSNTYIGVGAVYESYRDCNQTTFTSCSDAYPEVSITIAF